MMQKKMILPKDLPENLLAWYDKSKRSMRWRDNPTPYYVWVSEIMLQQTRVEAVREYFDRFVEALPDIKALAEAPEEALLKLWEGLGYYRRVRNLQAAAKIVMEQYGGEMPGDFAALRALPGIGDYTAGAIASIAFGKPNAAVDGNVLRVLSRITEDEREISDPSVKREYTEALEKIYPKGRCGDFTQSLMELGAMVCVPNGAPLCDVCPMRDGCGAYLCGTTDCYPVKTEKKPRKKQKLTVFLLHSEGKYAIGRRGDVGLLAGLWELPNTCGHLTPPKAKAYLEEIGIRTEKIQKLPSTKHIFTHIEWDMQVYRADCENRADDLFRWMAKDEINQEISLPTAFRKIWKV